MLIAQISDFHVRPAGKTAYGVSETNPLLERAIHALLRLDPAPDCVLATGDIADGGLEDEYRFAADLLARLPFPVFCIPGNHDRREPFRTAFAAAGYLPASGRLQYAIDRGGVRIIALDSLVPGQGGGALDRESLDFLVGALREAPGRPTLVMLHHPPFDTGIAHVDRVALTDGRDELRDIIAAHPQVERVLCGHVHRSIQCRFAGTIAQTAPSVAHQIAFNLRPDGEPGFVLEPPAFLVHRIHGGHVVTHEVQVDRAAGPFPFAAADPRPGRA